MGGSVDYEKLNKVIERLEKWRLPTKSRWHPDRVLQTRMIEIEEYDEYVERWKKYQKDKVSKSNKI